jgi:hypothetical protein
VAHWEAVAARLSTVLIILVITSPASLRLESSAEGYLSWLDIAKLLRMHSQYRARMRSKG